MDKAEMERRIRVNSADIRVNFFLILATIIVVGWAVVVFHGERLDALEQAVGIEQVEK